ncbi:hypothetical protein DU478_12090 [Thalassococcus profundi]|uniref:Uncharacterized protein n=1 Tax=Thalassococcus profundi TaxID=2282382 RepID=A0A369TKT3_9RHOB|nr:hypothetical protein DU478_12090 [Thalassococcus profundi]
MHQHCPLFMFARKFLLIGHGVRPAETWPAPNVIERRAVLQPGLCIRLVDRQRIVTARTGLADR